MVPIRPAEAALTESLVVMYDTAIATPLKSDLLALTPVRKISETGASIPPIWPRVGASQMA